MTSPKYTPEDEINLSDVHTYCIFHFEISHFQIFHEYQVALQWEAETSLNKL